MDNTLLTNSTNSSTPEYAGSILWIVVCCTIIIATFIGNILTIFAITLSRQLSSTISNQFIFSLAVSDLFVGMTIPYHMCFYLIESFGKTKRTCIIRFVLISFACASSIFNLFLIATDRYIAIVYPLRYNRYMTRRFSILLISIGWLISLTISIIPIYWNLWYDGIECEIDMVLPANYFYVIITPMFILVWSAMLMVYIKIWREATQHAKRIRNVTNLQNMSNINDTKSIQVVMLTLGCFSICWIPYFIVIIYFRFQGNSRNLNLIYEIAFTMAVANSGMNPIIYAWKNANFQNAFWCLIRCHSLNTLNKKNSYITNHTPNTNLTKHESNGRGRKEEDLNGTEFEIDNNSRRNEAYEDIEKDSSVNTEMTNINALA